MAGSFALPITRFDSMVARGSRDRRQVEHLDRVAHASIIEDYLATGPDSYFVLRRPSNGELLFCVRSSASPASGVGARLAHDVEVERLRVLGEGVRGE